MDIIVQKLPNGILAPVDEEGTEFLRKIKVGESVRVSITRPRNVKFHRKFYAMLDEGFGAFNPSEEFKGIPVQKDRERFRKDCIIQAGFRYAVARIDGSVRWEAESISFANMTEDRFELVYSAVANVLLEKVLTNYTRDDLDETVNRLLSFC